MKYLLKSSIAVFLVGLLFSSCSPEDLGNYDYHAINEVKIDLEKGYTGLFGEPFNIKPTIEFTQDKSNNTDRYQYAWYAYQKGALIGDIKKDPIDTTKNLHLQSLNLPPGSYDGVYRVTDTKTDVEWSRTFNLNVESTISKGWLVLNDINGKARLDMVSYYNDAFHTIHGVLAYTQSELELKGAPVNVLAYPYEPGFYGVYVTTTGNGTTKINPNTFGWENTYRLSYEMYGNVATNFAAGFIQPIGNGGKSYMYKDGNIYYYYRVYQYRYGTPINSIPGEGDFVVSPFIGTADFGASILYDQGNKRFVRHLAGGTTCSTMPAGTLFDYNTGKDLIYMAQTHYNNDEIFALLKDPATSQLFLARIRSNYSGVTQLYYKEIPAAIAADMNQADFFAVSPDFGYIFYNVGSKVYEYDFGIESSKLMLDKGAQVITALKFQATSNTPNQLVVASYSNGKGTMELYTVPPVNGDLVLKNTYTGFGKIVSISYKQL